MLNMIVMAVLMATAAPAVLSQGQCPPIYPHCMLQMKNWHLGIDRVRPSGAVVHGHANTPVSSGGLQGSAHGSRVIGGPYNGASSVGGGVNYQHPSGLQGGLDFTHSRGQGNVVSGSVCGRQYQARSRHPLRPWRCQHRSSLWQGAG